MDKRNIILQICNNIIVFIKALYSTPIKMNLNFETVAEVWSIAEETLQIRRKAIINLFSYIIKHGTDFKSPKETKDLEICSISDFGCNSIKV